MSDRTGWFLSCLRFGMCVLEVCVCVCVYMSMCVCVCVLLDVFQLRCCCCRRHRSLPEKTCIQLAVTGPLPLLVFSSTVTPHFLQALFIHSLIHCLIAPCWSDPLPRWAKMLNRKLMAKAAANLGGFLHCETENHLVCKVSCQQARLS